MRQLSGLLFVILAIILLGANGFMIKGKEVPTRKGFMRHSRDAQFGTHDNEAWTLIKEIQIRPVVRQ